jgi:ubiquinone/menaquinone biosynthesis C-methylase UbiE
VAALDLHGGQVVLDLACGRGGYGLEIARRSGARVVGVDFSAVAIGQAQRQAQTLGLADRADFRVGELTRTGLNTASVDAVRIVDSIQFAEPTLDALRECLYRSKSHRCMSSRVVVLVDESIEDTGA